MRAFVGHLTFGFPSVMFGLAKRGSTTHEARRGMSGQARPSPKCSNCCLTPAKIADAAASAPPARLRQSRRRRAGPNRRAHRQRRRHRARRIAAAFFGHCRIAADTAFAGDDKSRCGSSFDTAIRSARRSRDRPPMNREHVADRRVPVSSPASCDCRQRYTLQGAIAPPDRDNFGMRHHLDIGRCLDAVDPDSATWSQRAPRRAPSRGHWRRLAGEVDGRLPGRIAAAHQHDLAGVAPVWPRSATPQ